MEEIVLKKLLSTRVLKYTIMKHFGILCLVGPFTSHARARALPNNFYNFTMRAAGSAAPAAAAGGIGQGSVRGLFFSGPDLLYCTRVP